MNVGNTLGDRHGVTKWIVQASDVIIRFIIHTWKDFKHPLTLFHGWNLSKMVFFNGSLKLKICEADKLRPTDFATRHQMSVNKNVQYIDPYITIDIDEVPVARTTTKSKTVNPVWNEDFVTEVHNGANIGLTVFHDAAIPPDEFVANCNIPFDDIKGQVADIRVSK